MSTASRAPEGSANFDDQENNNMQSRLRGPVKPAAGQENQENHDPFPTKPGHSTRTVLGALLIQPKNKTQNQRAAKQEASQPLSCKNEEFTKPPAFQIHVDEPDGTCARKPQQDKLHPLSCKNEEFAKPPASQIHVEETDRTSTKKEAKSSVNDSLKISNAVARLRKPLAPIEVHSAMDISFDSPMDMSVVAEGEVKVSNVNEAPEYADEIHAYLREMEVKTRPKAGYMKKQPDITNSMRAILVDWLVEVGEEYRLQNETLYLAVNYIDRFLSSMSVLRGKLQLVGTAAMLLASKFEEIYPPEVAEFVYITDDTYTKKQVLRMEHLVLKVLSFDLAVPTINQFLNHYFLQHNVGRNVESLAMYLGELSLVDSDPFLKYLPSQTAAAAYVLANHTVTGGSWPKSLAEWTSYSLEDLMPCIEDLHQMYRGASTHAQQSVREKYKGSKYHEVSTIQAPTELLLQ